MAAIFIPQLSPPIRRPQYEISSRTGRKYEKNSMRFPMINYVLMGHYHDMVDTILGGASIWMTKVVYINDVICDHFKLDGKTHCATTT